MYDNFRVGKVSRIQTAHPTSFKGLSENAKDYWWEDPLVGVSGKISKSSDEGIMISRLLKQSCSSLRNFMMFVAFRNMNQGGVRLAVDIAYSRGKRDGARNAKRYFLDGLRKLVGLDEMDEL